MSEFKITEEKENPLFNRREIKGAIESEITPSRAEILEILSKKFKVPLENIKIKKILGKFGSKTFAVEANIYSSEKEKDSIELKKKKEKPPEEREEAPKEKAEEKPIEEKPEEQEQKQPEAVSEKESDVQQNTESKSQERTEPQGEAKEQ